MLSAAAAIILLTLLTYLLPTWPTMVVHSQHGLWQPMASSPYPLGFVLILSALWVGGLGFVRGMRAKLGAGPTRPFATPPRTSGADGPPNAPPKPRMTTHALGLRMLGFFGLISAALLLFSPQIFAEYDRIVGFAGQLVYWPRPWPSAHLAVAGTLSPDLILLMYVAGMASYLSAIFPLDRGNFPRGTTARVLTTLGAYFVSAVLLDVALTSLGLSGFFGSLRILGQALLGGSFFSLLIFGTLVVPPPIAVKRPLRRDRGALPLFLGSVGFSLFLAGFMLYLAWNMLGLGQVIVGFAILLLLPVYTLMIWALLGIAVYDIHVDGRPRPSVARYHPRVTVIIPAYNEEENIGFAVAGADAAAALYPGETEILVGNDGSSDRTSVVAQAAIDGLKHARGRVLNLPHLGKSNPLNAMLREARGEVVVRVDGDCRLSGKTGFNALIPHFADPEVGGVQGLLLPLQNDGWTRKLRFMEIAWNHLFLRRAQMAFRAAEVVDGAFCAFRRQDLVDAGGWVDWNGEDTEITLRMQRRGFRMRFETGSTTYEDVPEDFSGLKKQRVRWNRGGIFAHMRHYGALFNGAPEYGGIALALWLTMFARGGMRHMIYLYAVLATVILALPTLENLAVIVGLLFVPRAVVIGYWTLRMHWTRELRWLPIWPAAAAFKQYFVTESFGTMLPGMQREFFE